MDLRRLGFLAVLLVKIGRPVEQPRTGFAAKRIPAYLRGMRGADHAVDVLGARLEHRSDLDPRVVGRSDGPFCALAQGRPGDPAAAFESL